MYIADYALRHGDGAAQDRALGERMIRSSDDDAASQLSAKYPGAINAEAAEFHLADTRQDADWGSSYTSTADVAAFLQAKQNRDPGSPILGWMMTANKVAADGTAQNWGTANLPQVTGTKWGWSDSGAPQVASASFGPGFSVSAQTQGSAADQTADVLAALPTLLLQLIPH
jgi:hypothetical protein